MSAETSTMVPPLAELVGPKLADAISDTQNQLATMMINARRSLRARAHSIHPELNTMGFKAIMLLHGRGGMHQSEIVRHLNADKALLSRMLKHLEELGLIQRSADPNDGRAMLVDLTPSARESFELTQSDARQLLVNKLAQWDVAEVRRLAELLARLNETAR